MGLEGEFKGSVSGVIKYPDKKQWREGFISSYNSYIEYVIVGKSNQNFQQSHCIHSQQQIKVNAWMLIYLLAHDHLDSSSLVLQKPLLKKWCQAQWAQSPCLH